MDQSHGHHLIFLFGFVRRNKLPCLPVNDQRGKGSFLCRMLLSYDNFWNSARTSLLVLLHRLPQFLQGFFLQAGDVPLIFPLAAEVHEDLV